MNIFKPLIAILSVFLSIGFGITLVEMIFPFDFNLPSVQYFFTGFSIFSLLWFIWFKNKHFYSTFEHELTHLLVGLLFFKKPSHFTVTSDSGGETGLYGGNFIITLAPYFLPTFSFLMLPVYLIILPEFYQYYFIIFGFFVAYHVFSTIQEFSYSQPDIIMSGKLFSTLFLVFTNILVYGYLIVFVIGGFKSGLIFLKQGSLESYNYIIKLIAYFG